jgi:hypothetical protein
MRLRLGILLLLLFSAAACTTGGSGSSEPRRDRNRLVQEELDEWNQFTAWDAVQRLRPMWMRPGGVRNSANPAGHYPYVFADGSPYGPMESLRSFRVENLQEMQFVDATDATIRYGGQYQGGVILLTTKRKP